MKKMEISVLTRYLIYMYANGLIFIFDIWKSGSAQAPIDPALLWACMLVFFNVRIA